MCLRIEKIALHTIISLGIKLLLREMMQSFGEKGYIIVLGNRVNGGQVTIIKVLSVAMA